MDNLIVPKAWYQSEVVIYQGESKSFGRLLDANAVGLLLDQKAGPVFLPWSTVSRVRPAREGERG